MYAFVVFPSEVQGPGLQNRINQDEYKIYTLFTPQGGAAVWLVADIRVEIGGACTVLRNWRNLC